MGLHGICRSVDIKSWGSTIPEVPPIPTVVLERRPELQPRRGRCDVFASTAHRVKALLVTRCAAASCHRFALFFSVPMTIFSLNRSCQAGYIHCQEGRGVEWCTTVSICSRVSCASSKQQVRTSKRVYTVRGSMSDSSVLEVS